MKPSFAAIFIMSLPFFAHAQRPAAPGIRQAEQVDAQSQREIPPPRGPHTTLDLSKLRRDADELSSLAQSVPAEIDGMTKGLLPKDLVEKLKRIEKLAKQLRSQVAP